MFGILQRVGSIIEHGLRVASNAISRWTKPISHAPAVAALARRKSDLIAENLLLRQQLIVLNRSSINLGTGAVAARGGHCTAQ